MFENVIVAYNICLLSFESGKNVICKDFSKKVASIFIVLMYEFKFSLTVGDGESHV